MKRFTYLPFFLALLFLFPLTGTLAQNAADDAEKEKKVTIKISTSDQGNTEETTTEISLEGISDIEDLLRELELLDEIDIAKDGERLEISIKKYDDNTLGREIEVELDRLGEDLEDHFENIEWMTEGKEVKRAFLGVYVRSVTEEEATELGLEEGVGAAVKEPIEGTAAYKAGIQSGDVIVEIDGQKVGGYNDVVKMIRAHEPGDEVEVVYYHEGQQETQTIALGEKVVREKNYNYSFPHQLKTKCEVIEEEKAFLGVTNGGMEDGGMKIASVVSNSSAEKMGLEAGDIVKSVNGSSTTNFKELGTVLKSLEPGQDVKIEIDRDGKDKTIKGEIGSRTVKRYKKVAINNGPKEIIMIGVSIEDLSDEDVQKMEQNNLPTSMDLPIENVTFSPNPSDGKFNIAFNLPEEGETKIRIVDLNGREVLNNNIGVISGNYAQEIDITGEPNGVYFMFIIQNERQFYKKIVKQE